MNTDAGVISYEKDSRNAHKDWTLVLQFTDRVNRLYLVAILFESRQCLKYLLTMNEMIQHKPITNLFR